MIEYSLFILSYLFKNDLDAVISVIGMWITNKTQSLLGPQSGLPAVYGQIRTFQPSIRRRSELILPYKKLFGRIYISLIVGEK